MKKRTTLLMFIWMIALSLVATTRMEMLSLSVNDRIPKDIKKVFIDSDGFAWYATSSGLYQDDGYHTTCYRADIHQPDLMKSNHITSVHEDAQGNIWIGTRRGAYLLNKQTYKLSPITDTEVVDHVVNSINATSDGQMWLSTNEQLLRYGKQGELAARYPISHNVQQLYEDSKGNIWRILWRDGLAKYEVETDSFVSIEWPFAEHPSYMVEDRRTNGYWISVWERGLVKYIPQTDGTDQFIWPKNAMQTNNAKENKIHQLLNWKDRYLITLLEEGKLQVYENGDTLRRVTESEADTLLPLNREKTYSHIHPDGNECLWLTEPEVGIWMLKIDNHIGQGTRHIAPATPVVLAIDSTGCWFQDNFTRKYNQWCLKTGEIKRLPNSDKIIDIKKARKNTGIYAVRKYNDMVRFYNNDGQVAIENMFTYTLPDDKRIRTFHEDAYGRFWLGTNQGLLCHYSAGKPIQSINGVKGLVHSITSDLAGRLFVVTEGRKLYIIYPDELKPTVTSYDLQEDFSRLITSAQGDIWGITLQGGLHLFAEEQKAFVSYSQKMGLTGEAIVDIAFDSHNRIWLLYNQNLIIHDPHQGDMPRFISANMMGGSPLWSLFQDETGQMHIGCGKGIATFDANSFTSDDDENIPLILTALETNGERRMYPLTDQTVIVKLDEDEKEVKLYFSTLDLANASNVRMAWRWHGKKEWTLIPPGENSVYLTDLDRGEYAIEMRATTVNGAWSKSDTAFFIHRPYPWYLGMWARLIYFVIICSLIAWGIQQLKQSISTQKKKQKILEETTTKETAPTKDSLFMQQVKERIKQQLSNADYSIEDLSNDMAMSRASLHRKVKADCGMTPTELMRTMRLNRAAELLKEGKLNVNEVAYSVGFSTPGYFTQSFKKQFGVLPSEFR